MCVSIVMLTTYDTAAVPAVSISVMTADLNILNKGGTDGLFLPARTGKAEERDFLFRNSFRGSAHDLLFCSFVLCSFLKSFPGPSSFESRSPMKFI